MRIEISLADYTIGDFAAFWHAFVRKKPGDPSPDAVPPKPILAAGRFFCWFFIVLGALCIFNSLWQGKKLYMEDAGWLFNLFLTTPLGGVVAMAFGGLCLRRLRKDAHSPHDPMAPPYPRWAKRSWKRYQSAPRLRVCRFDGEGCWLYDAQSDHRYDYDMLENLWEDREHYYLVLMRTQIYILPKRAFTAGTPEDLANLWQERTGKTVRAVTPERA